MLPIKLEGTWGFVALGTSLVLIAFLINRLAPQRRPRIRHVVFLYLSFLLCGGVEHSLAWMARSHPTLSPWVTHVHLASALAAALTSVSLGALFVFDFALPVLQVSIIAITGDLIVGLAYAFAALGVLRAEGFSPSSVVTTSAFVSGVIALSLQATLGNILGGVALQLDGSFHVGDWLQLPDGQQGQVVAIRWRHTVLETRNWDSVVVPNSSLLAQNIVILGKRTGRPLQHRIWVYFNVDFRFPPSQVIEAVQSALWASPIEGVAVEPKPSVICCDFAKEGRDSFAYYAVRYWLTDFPNDDPTSSRIRVRISAALRRSGIPLARPVQTIFINPEEDEASHADRLKKRRIAAVEPLELFHSMTPDERNYVADHLRYAPFTAGETVTRQGAQAHFLYILCTGEVEVRRHGDEGHTVKVVAHLRAPGFFGEMGLLTGEPRGADVVALTDIECYRLDKEGLERILHERPEIAEELSRTVARRQVEMGAIREDLDAQAHAANMVTAQLNILDKIQRFFGLARTSIS
jgi:small-conductance mechanosensitive channel